jgi:hypothetical protein
VNVAALKVEKLAVPVEQAWREVGYSAGEIRDFKAQRAREKAQLLAADARARAKQVQPPAPPAAPPNGNPPLAAPPQPGAGGPSGMPTPEPTKGIYR